VWIYFCIRQCRLHWRYFGVDELLSSQITSDYSIIMVLLPNCYLQHCWHSKTTLGPYSQLANNWSTKSRSQQHQKFIKCWHDWTINASLKKLHSKRIKHNYFSWRCVQNQSYAIILLHDQPNLQKRSKWFHWINWYDLLFCFTYLFIRKQ